MHVDRPKSIRKLWWIAIITAVLLSSSYGFYLFNIKNSAVETLNRFSSQSSDFEGALKNGDLKIIQEFLRLADQETAKLSKQINNWGLPAIFSALDLAKPGLGSAPEAASLIASLSHHSLTAANELKTLIDQGPAWFFNQQGADLLNNLKILNQTLAKAELEIVRLNSSLKQFKMLSPMLANLTSQLKNHYLPALILLNRSRESLEGLLALLEKTSGSNMAFIFQNPAEIRPAGGFIGSYGVLTIKEGGLSNLFIDDIYNADRQLTIEKIPPRELQSITSHWGTRDANWFFDFPTSAKKIEEFLAASKIFKDRNVQFDGLIAINTEVLQSLFEAIGPIRLENYNLTLDNENFLAALQHEVEAGRDKTPGQNPKRILNALAPLLIEKIKNLDEEQKILLQQKLTAHLSQKDIMLYFHDTRLENAVLAYGLGGEGFALPNNFSGNYLAGISTNIGEDKSDAFMTQSLKLKTQIGSDGGIANELEITRRHSGQNQKDWWYRSTNKNYLKVFAPKGSKIKSIQGQSPAPKITALENGLLLTDADLNILENSSQFSENLGIFQGTESGKTTFGFWLNTPAGKTRTALLNYKSPPILLANQLPYELVLEKQSGAASSLEYQITAPAGYIFQESGASIFQYKIPDLRGREKIKLTLLKQS